MIKRLFDLVTSAIGLCMLAPVFALTALLIKLDSPGPVFFRQERVGRNEVPFRILKLRTMQVGTEFQGQITVGRDPRVTRIGRVLRSLKIDELPQLFNVLVGDMSIVGPRPEVPRYVAHYPPEVRALVLSVAPGITDRASIEFKDENQILGGASNPESVYVNEILPVKLEYYVRYVEKHGFWTDLKIIFLTLGTVWGAQQSSVSTRFSSHMHGKGRKS